MAHDLRAIIRLASGRKADPSAAVLDGRTMQSTPESGGRAGYDGYKRRKGTKVHVAVDTLGHLLAVKATPANEQERAQVGDLVEQLQQATCDSVKVVFADQGYTGDEPAQQAEAHGVEPGQIAKTLSLWLKDEAILLLLGGDARIDNPKFKARFQTKARMLNADEVVHWTGHPVGGVCPFGLAHPMRVFADVSLRRFDTVLPAAGATHSAVRLSPDRLVALVAAEWVDVSQTPPA
jgi:prolyl-tRNA editing enzyme YbaK/EbsC (Cys-tRNA(Pro) deacylase)